MENNREAAPEPTVPGSPTRSRPRGACSHRYIARFVAHIFGAVCAANGIEHRQTKPYHPWTNGQAERMVRTIKEATVKSFHYASIDDLRRHVRDWLLAYNDAKQLKALRFRTPFEAIRQISETKPEIFNRSPSHDMLGSNTEGKLSQVAIVFACVTIVTAATLLLWQGAALGPMLVVEALAVIEARAAICYGIAVSTTSQSPDMLPNRE